MRAKLNCPHCDGILVVPSEASGRRAECTHCGGYFNVPDFDEVIDNMATS
jgi:primosomal protein N'